MRSLPHITLGAALSCLVGLTACEPDTGADERVVLQAHENAREFGRHVIRVNALTTDQLDPDVASGYGITRSKSRVLLNIVISENTDHGTRPARAELQVVAKNLSNQVKDIAMREITSGEAIYYVGEVGVSDGETLVFNIDFTPPGADTPHKLSYHEQFFTE